MKKTIKKIIEMAFSLLGVVLALYVGGYLFLIEPVHVLYVRFMADTLTSKTLFVCIVKIFLASTVSGGIWCICDIIAGKFRD